MFLHGWPESSRTWAEIMTLAAGSARVIAIDLPGVGESAGTATDGSKRQIAGVVDQFLSVIGVSAVTLVGHDIGGMVTYAYLRAHQGIDRAVIMDVPLPGVAPWDEFVRSPFLFHFALHAVPDLPERLVRGRQADYFGYFYDALSADPSKITEDARRAYQAAYASDSALTASFSSSHRSPRTSRTASGPARARRSARPCCTCAVSGNGAATSAPTCTGWRTPG